MSITEEELETWEIKALLGAEVPPPEVFRRLIAEVRALRGEIERLTPHAEARLATLQRVREQI